MSRTMRKPAKVGRSKPASRSFRYKEQFGVIVICAGEREQRRIYNRLAREGLKCKVVVT